MPGRPRSFEPSAALTQAMDVFWARGYEATGIAHLEVATGLGRQSLYGAFGDKRTLFAKVVEHYFDNVIKPALIDVLDAPGSGRANIERVFAIWEAAALADDFRGCLVGNGISEVSSKDHAMAEVLVRKLTMLEAAFTRAIRRAQKDGEINKGIDAKALAGALVAISQGLSITARVRHSRSQVRGVLEQARRLLD
ncbi:MAG TPA: TetR/AcrR family transcriptional regulator [Polyangiaceae bacterium]